MKNRSHFVSTKAKKQVKQYPEDFYDSSGYFFCKFCQKTVIFRWHLDNKETSHN